MPGGASDQVVGHAPERHPERQERKGDHGLPRYAGKRQTGEHHEPCHIEQDPTYARARNRLTGHMRVAASQRAPIPQPGHQHLEDEQHEQEHQPREP